MARCLKPRPQSLATLLDREQDEFDRIMAEVHPGVNGPAHYDDLEERADGMCRRIRAAFRTSRGDA